MHATLQYLSYSNRFCCLDQWWNIYTHTASYAIHQDNRSTQGMCLWVGLQCPRLTQYADLFGPINTVCVHLFNTKWCVCTIISNSADTDSWAVAIAGKCAWFDAEININSNTHWLTAFTFCFCNATHSENAEARLFVFICTNYLMQRAMNMERWASFFYGKMSKMIISRNVMCRAYWWSSFTWWDIVKMQDEYSIFKNRWIQMRNATIVYERENMWADIILSNP